MNLRYILIAPFVLFASTMLSSQIDSLALQEFIKLNKEIYSDEFMVIHKSEQIIHWKGKDCDSIYFGTASMLKSWTGILIGALIQNGIIESEDDAYCKYVKEWEAACENNVSIKHLLTMSAGLDKKRGADGILDEIDMNGYALNLELDTLPGIRFSYSNASVQLLAVLIEETTGMKAQAAFEKFLFEPLAMDSTSLYIDESGNDIVYGGARTTLEDASKIAMLMINKGSIGDLKLVSEDWINRSITASALAPFYGYLWWLDTSSEDFNYAAMGDYGQMTIVYPELELIYLRKQNCNHTKSGNMRFMGPAFLKEIANLVK